MGILISMKFDQINSTSSLRMRLALVVTMLLIPITVFGQEFGEPLTGPEILSETVQIEHSGYSACALRNTSDVFCWERGLPLVNTSTEFFPDTAGFSKLNEALNNDIARITLDGIHLCGIGKESGVACVASDRPRVIAYTSMQRPPEPDASYLSISDLGSISSAIACAIQTDNRVVCWGARGSNSIPVLDVPPEAAYLEQIDLLSFRACGIDFNNAVVCWGLPSRLSNGDDRLFGDVDISSIGPAKQISMGSSGACIIDIDDNLECFGRINSYTNILSDKSFSSIELDGSNLCFETTSGEKDCLSLTFSEDSTSAESLFPTDADVRLVSPRGSFCYVTTDNTMSCTVDNGSRYQSQFPTAPQNLSVNLFSDTQAELTWARPNQDRFTDDFATGYEIFRDGVFIERLPVVTSYFDNGSNPNARYEVRATRALVAGSSSFINADGSIDPLIPMEPTPSTPVSAPTTPTTTDDGFVEIGLRGTVYSSTALELFYNNVQIGGSTVTYNILRDDEVIRENSPATSQFQADLEMNTSYNYEVQAVLDGNVISTDSITLTTFNDGSGPVVTASGVDVVLSGAVYSSSAVELFWNRASVANVTYNVYRDGELVRQNTPAVSHYDGQLAPDNNFQYEVVALLDGDVVASSIIEIDTKSGSVSEPIASVTQPSSTGPQQLDVGPIELSGVVYSSTALELTWKRAAIPGVTYNIFRDGEIIRENSPAISQFQSGLLPNTLYSFTVTPLSNGIEQVSETIELSTRNL